MGVLVCDIHKEGLGNIMSRDDAHGFVSDRVRVVSVIIQRPHGLNAILPAIRPVLPVPIEQAVPHLVVRPNLPVIVTVKRVVASVSRRGVPSVEAQVPLPDGMRRVTGGLEGLRKHGLIGGKAVWRVRRKHQHLEPVPDGVAAGVDGGARRRASRLRVIPPQRHAAGDQAVDGGGLDDGVVACIHGEVTQAEIVRHDHHDVGTLAPNSALLLGPSSLDLQLGDHIKLLLLRATWKLASLPFSGARRNPCAQKPGSQHQGPRDRMRQRHCCP
mmetsp:Transcript_43358/g.131026  ORF Transcript_43358/g.131026 Transcript_43358/m.131026 type:complete len:271 (+) Transcript_43358:977-1789(+)